jgi:hypothetical protein
MLTKSHQVSAGWKNALIHQPLTDIMTIALLRLTDA